jgi:polysaccharide export outer membrane protein
MAANGPGMPGRRCLLLAVAACAGLSAGCFSGPPLRDPTVEATGPVAYASQFADPRYDGTLPRELQKVTMPEYIIEPPDILRIELLRVTPPPGYKIEPGDILFLQITYPGQAEPFAGEVLVGPDGQINLGTTFGGVVKVSGLTVEEARQAVEKKATDANVKNPRAQVSLIQSRALAQIRGEYLVRPDGTVGLGTYGNVRLVGQTLTQARSTIEKHLAGVLTNPEVAVDVAAYNSKIYYVIYDGGGRGQQVVRLPITGNDTVLDAVAQLNGLSPVSSQHHIWVARPSPANVGQEMIMPVDWHGIAESAMTATNYQLMPGDRIYVKAHNLVTIDNWVAMLVAPVERVFGVTLLGQTTVQTLRHPSILGVGLRNQ